MTGLGMERMAFHVHITARTEGFVAGSGEHHHADVGTLAADGHGIEHLVVGLGAERVVDLRAVNRYLGDTVVVIEEYVLILLNGFPVKLFHIVSFLRF